MLREKLVEITLEWEKQFGVAPNITGTVSEYDAAMLVGMSEKEYSNYMQGMTAVHKGFDFLFNGIRYQIKACRPSGKPGSKVTRLPTVSNYDFDKFIWILYNKEYEIQEAWEWDVKDFAATFPKEKRINPKEIRAGKPLFPMHGNENGLRS